MDETEGMAQTQAALGALAAAVRGGHDFDRFAAEAAESLQAAVPFDAFCVGLIDPATNLLTRTRKIGLDGIAEEGFLFWEYAQEDVAQFRELMARPVGVSILDQETAGDKNVSGRFREVVATQIGAEHEVRGVARLSGSTWGAYALYRAPGATPFQASEAAFLHRVEALLARGLRASLVVAAAHGALQATAAGPAVLIFDADGALAHATAAAAERLDELGGSLEGGLPAAVAAVVQEVRGAGSPPGSAHTRVRAASGHWYTLHAAPLASAGSRPLTAVTIEPATPPQILPLLVSAYGLTEREATIVQAMLRGDSTQAIATSLFLSPYTVQDHFKSVFEKIGVSSRREVASRVFYGQYLGTTAP